ncbi:MAG: ABC transporter permease subunit [Chloroflexi bacterium]|nr:ABC transporter permease subunit [Chloroflexota bacterium]
MQHAAVPFWRDVRVIAIISQILFILILILAAAFFYNNLTSAMRQRGLAAGYDYLEREAAFEIGESLIEYKPTDTYGRAFAVGLLNTLLVSVVGIVLSTILGVITGVARLSSNWLANNLAAWYIEVIRNTPLLVQLIFIYFGVFVKFPPVRESIELPGSIYASQRGIYLPKPLPTDTFQFWLAFIAAAVVIAIIAWVMLTRHPRMRYSFTPHLSVLAALIIFPLIGWFAAGASPLNLELPERGRFNFSGGIALSPEFGALVFGLVIYTAAFIAEVVRGGIQAVSKGQIEAARAVGLGEGQTLSLVVFPQAMRVIIPPLTSQYLNLAKNSSLAVAIGYPDLFSVNQTIANQTGQPVPAILLVMGTYLAMSLFTSLLMNLYNRRVQILER